MAKRAGLVGQNETNAAVARAAINQLNDPGLNAEIGKIDQAHEKDMSVRGAELRANAATNEQNQDAIERRDRANRRRRGVARFLTGESGKARLARTTAELEAGTKARDADVNRELFERNNPQYDNNGNLIPETRRGRAGRGIANVWQGGAGAEAAKLGAEAAEKRYQNSVDEQKLSARESATGHAGRLYGAQTRLNTYSRQADTLQEALKSDQEDQKALDNRNLERLRLTQNRSKQSQDIQKAKTLLSDEADLRATEVITSGAPHNMTAEQVANAQAKEAQNVTSQTVAAAEKEVEAATNRVNLVQGSASHEATRILNHATRDAESSGETIKAEAREQAELDGGYVEEMRESGNRIEGANARIKTVQTARNEAEVTAGTGTGHAAASAKELSQAADESYEAAIARSKLKVNPATGARGSLFREGQIRDRTTRAKTSANKQVEAQSKRREENDTAYLDEVDAANRSITGSQAVIDARSKAGEEGDIDYQNKVNAAGRRKEVSTSNIEANTEEAKDKDGKYIEDLRQSKERLETAQGSITEKTEKNKQAALRSSAGRGPAAAARKAAALRAATQKLRTKAAQDNSSAAETAAMQNDDARVAAQRADMNKRAAEGEDAAKDSQRILEDDRLRQLDSEIRAHTGRKSTLDNVVSTEHATAVANDAVTVDGQGYADYTGATDLASTPGLSFDSQQQMTARRGKTAANAELDKIARAQAEATKAFLDQDQDPRTRATVGREAINAADANSVVAVTTHQLSTEDNDQAMETLIAATRNKAMMNDPKQARRLFGPLLGSADFRSKSPLGATYMQYVAGEIAAAANEGRPANVLSFEEALADPTAQLALLKNLDASKLTAQDYDMLEKTLDIGGDAAAFVRENIIDKYGADMTIHNKSLADVVVGQGIFAENEAEPGSGQRSLRHSANTATLGKLRMDDIRAFMGDTVEVPVDPNNPNGPKKRVAATFRPKNPKKEDAFRKAKGNQPDDMDVITDYEAAYDAAGDPQNIKHMIDIMVTNLNSPNPQEYEAGALDLMASYARSAGFEKVNGRWIRP
jgi:colicin import membrane protein